MTEEILLGRCGVCGNVQEFSAFGWRSNIRQQFRCNNCSKLRLFSYAGKKAIKSDKETTQFTCGSCGEKWNLVSPKSDTDTCPECGVTVYSNSKRQQK